MSLEAYFYLLFAALSSNVINQVDSGKAQNQLQDWSTENGGRVEKATDFRGCPIPSLTASLSVGEPSGPLLLSDSNLIDNIARFNRERIPERSVHAKGSGAFGYFTVTNDITKYTKAKVFSKQGKTTDVLVRFSTVTGEMGSSDQVQDSRGFAIKFYTDDGNWDLAGINFLNFPIRDPFLFPFLVRTRKRNPRTHLEDPNMRWDFDSQRPETTFNNLFRQSGLGRPDGYRHMDGFGVHAFKLVNSKNEISYCKFHLKTNQGIKNLTVEGMAKINGENLDYGTEDLYNAIGVGNYPSWTMYIQVMTEHEADNYKWNAFDATKVWLEEDFPLMKVGHLVLNRNPTDYFTEVEESGFDPGNFVPGIEASPDKLLHGRIFSYQDAQRERLGANRGLIEVNKPKVGVKVRNYNRDGLGVTDPLDNGAGGPNYFPNSFDSINVDPEAKDSVFRLNADAVRYDSVDDDNFSQAKYYWKNVFNEEDRKDVASSIASTLKLTYKYIQRRAIKNFRAVSHNLAKMIEIEMAKS